MRFRRSQRGARARQLGAVIVSVVMAVSIAPGVGATGPGDFTATDVASNATETISVSKSDAGRTAQTDPSLLGKTDSTPISVLIKYDFDATASYAGRVTGLAATSPSTTGKKLKDNRAAVQAYEAYTGRLTQRINAAVKSTVPSAQMGASYLTAYGGVQAVVPANELGKLLSVAGVAAVQSDVLQQPLTDATPQFIGATDVWPSLGGSTKAGQGVLVGVLDTGIWPEHPSFRDTGLAAAPGTRKCEFGDGSDPELGAPFTCNNKLVGAYAFTNTYINTIPAVAGEFCNNSTKKCSARDSEGHGTHTSSTAAGDGVASAPLLGFDRGPISGIAPGAWLIMYRVCLEQGCFNSDSVAAVQQAIVDGVDVINFSISGGANPYTDPVELAFLDAFRAGIAVNASAGNSGPGAGTANHGGPWVTTVGASTSNRFFTSRLHLASSDGATFDKAGVTVTSGITTPTPVVLASSIPGYEALCLTPLPAGAAQGKIVACQRGNNARVDKGYNVLQGGAAGMILYNPTRSDVETDNHWLPAIHLEGPNADLTGFISGHPNVTATWPAGTRSATQGDVMAGFSSRGPLGDFIKPDITAPGIQVLAGHTPAPIGITNGPSGQLFQAIAGTSMSSPHSAGASALVKAAHPDWTPAEIKSALMGSAVQTPVKEDGVTPFDPFDAGAGALRVNRAVRTPLVFNETYDHYLGSAADPLHRIDLNLSSVDAPTMTGSISTKRTARNVSGQNEVFKVTTTAPAGASLVVGSNNANLSVKAGESITFPITISGPTLANGQYFGRITLDAQKAGIPQVTIPVAFVKRQGVVTLTHSCSPTTFPVGALSHCTAGMTNLAPRPAQVNLSITGSSGLEYFNVSPGATLIAPHFGVQWSGTLSPALPPTIDSITATTGPTGGYVPLSAFGVAPFAAGDDTITNFNVPTFYYGAEPYSRVGVVSNGYLVIGGGTSTDIVFLPQTLPNAARPNNVIAGLWSDLNPAGGGGAGAIRIATLTDGSTTWLVVDWNGIKNFSDATTHTFEIWLRLDGGGAGTGPSSEQVTLSYGTANTASPDPASGGNSGAENRDGTSGKNLATPANDTEWSVNTSPPTPGGSQVVTYDLSAKLPKTYSSTASMTSNLTPGSTQVVQQVTVTP